NLGIRRELGRVFGGEHASRLTARYHELEREVQREDPSRSYADVMSEAMRRLGAPEGEEDALGRSLPSWEPFPEVTDALRELRERGWRLAILSNPDPDFLAASRARGGVP